MEFQNVKTKSRIFQIEIQTGAKTKKRYRTEYFWGTASSLITETWHDTVYLVWVNHSLVSPIVVLTTWRSYGGLGGGGLKAQKLLNEDPEVSIKTNDLWMYWYTFASLSFYLASSQQYHLSSILLNPSPSQVLHVHPYWFIQPFFIRHQEFARHCSRCWGTVRNKGDNDPAFMKMNSDEG